MVDKTRSEYSPDVVSPPGETLVEVLAASGMSQAELAERTGRPKKTINEIVKGKAMITSETAVQLERVLGVSAAFWARREATYRAYLARLDEEQELRAYTDWPAGFPVKEMVRHRWLRSVGGVDLVRELLSYFGIASPGALSVAYHSAFELRTSTKFEVDRNALAAWLRRGEIVAKEMECEPFERHRFVDALAEARRLTTLKPDHFVPRLVKLMRGVGVVVAFVPELPKTRAHGATKWVTPTKALIQLSCRYKRNDILWFSFFHEAGHLLLHGKKASFIDGTSDPTSDKEREADEFAANTLIAPRDLRAFIARGAFSEDEVRKFAGDVGVHPAIVVGRLRHDECIAQHQLSDLIERVTEEDLCPTDGAGGSSSRGGNVGG